MSTQKKWVFAYEGNLSVKESFYNFYGFVPNQLNVKRSLGEESLTEIASQFPDTYEEVFIKRTHYQGDDLVFSRGCLHFPAQKVIVMLCDSDPSYEFASQIYYCQDSDHGFVEKIHDILKENREDLKMEKRGKLEMISVGNFGDFDFDKFDIKPPSLDLKDIYPLSFMPIHDYIVKRLNTPLDKGLVILHGAPGTGKTTYIRHLIGQVNKPKIFVPPTVAGHLASPNFISALKKRSNSVLVVEDAENILMSREAGGNDAVSNLLNLSDGLLADCFNIQLICTFNTELSNIDPALLRKGRLIARYEFPKLSPEKVKEISRQMGKEKMENKEMSLAELTNSDSLTFASPRKRRRMGFRIEDEDLPF